MSGIRYVLSVAIAAAAMQATAHASELQTLKSVNVDLPTGERQFPGKDADAINNNCLACHSAGMVLNQPPFSRETWSATVNKMIHVYKAPVSDADAALIVEYLAAHHGTGQ